MEQQVKYRGYTISIYCGSFGIFADGFCVDVADGEYLAKAKIDSWHADWRAIIAKNPNDGLAESCRKAIAECGEEV